MENVFRISMLLDFYGQLLTARQYEILDLYCNNDYSLAEIAELLKISRQGVYDNIKRGEAMLCRLEKKLGLTGKFTEQKARAKEILDMIGRIDASKMSGEDRAMIEKIRQGIEEISEA